VLVLRFRIIQKKSNYFIEKSRLNAKLKFISSVIDIQIL